MTKFQFWKIIEESRNSFFKTTPTPNERGMIEGVMDHQAKSLREILAALPAEEIGDFDRIFDELMDRAYDWDLWAAAYIMDQGCSDDGFTDFRSWIVSMGKNVYEAALKNPETLVEAVDRKDVECFVFEEFAYVARTLYEEMTGKPPPEIEAEFKSNPSGKRWENDDELKKRFPILFAKCNP